MPFRGFALENIAGAAVGTNGFAGMQDVKINARMLVPQWRVSCRAMQGQVVSGDFDGERVGHVDLPVVCFGEYLLRNRYT